MNPVFYYAEGINQKIIMGDEETTNVDEVAEDVEEGAPDTETPEADTEDAPSGESDEGEGDATEGEESPDGDEDEEPPVRKPRTNADWVALRRQRKLEKQAKGKQQGEADDVDDEDNDDDLSDVSEEDLKIIEKVLDRRLKPIEQEREVLSIKTEIDEFVAQNPDFKPYANRALKWSQHPTWKNVPTKQLMFAAAGDNLLKMGAKRSQSAAEKARRQSTGKGTTGNLGGAKPVAEMTDEEFEQQLIRVKTGQA